MLRILGTTFAIAVAAAVFIAYFAMFTVDQRKQAIVLQFGAPIAEVTEPGLHFMVPFLQNVVIYEKRVLDLTVERAELAPADQKRVIVDAFVRWQIVDPLRFVQSQRTVEAAELSLRNRVVNSLQIVINRYQLQRLLSDQRDDIMTEIRETVNEKIAQERLGIEIVDVRLRQVELPQQNRIAIFERMKTARQAEANQARAEGRQRNLTTIALADTEVARIRSTAEAESSRLRGQGESARACAYAFLEEREPGFAAFYSFIRSMRAYENALGKDSTTMVLSPDTSFFQYFGDLKQRAPAPESPVGALLTTADRDRLFEEVSQRCGLTIPKAPVLPPAIETPLTPDPVVPAPATP
ncbi:MAG: protease modulator HflC [Alphaproteobacteria bacterium]|nr:protease modulator HflC [Alphaproteobacteria bacterium]